MGQKALCNARGRGIKRVVAAAFFGIATTIGGCGQFPQCQYYFKKEVTRQCTGFMENMQRAKAELREVKGHREYVKAKLRARVIKGDMEGLDAFNVACEELEEVSKEIERLKRLEMRVKRGDAVGEEVARASEGILDVIGRLQKVGRALVEI